MHTRWYTDIDLLMISKNDICDFSLSLAPPSLSLPAFVSLACLVSVYCHILMNLRLRVDACGLRSSLEEPQCASVPCAQGTEPRLCVFFLSSILETAWTMAS